MNRKGRHQTWVCPFCGCADVMVKKKRQDVVKLMSGSMGGSMGEEGVDVGEVFIRVYRCKNESCGMDFKTVEMIVL